MNTKPSEYYHLRQEYGQEIAENYLKVVSQPDYYSRSEEGFFRCWHRWKPLFECPTDEESLSLFEAQGLNKFYQCEDCDRIGKRDHNRTTLVAFSRQHRVLKKRDRWNQTLRANKRGEI